MAQAILLEDVEQARPARRPGRRLARLPAQLPDPAQAGDAGDRRARSRRRSAAATRPRKPSASAPSAKSEAASLLSKTVLTIHQRAGEDGKLFGSVGAKEIVEAIRDARDLRIDRRKVRLEQPIREIGTHMVEIELADGAIASVKTIITEER